jgi:tetratricopeptide (TPR) repeat protein
MKSYWVLLFFFVLTAFPVAAQMGSPNGQANCTIRIDVLMANGGHAPARLQVRLMEAMGNFPVAMDFTNDSGTADFEHLPPGRYHAAVSGKGIETADSGLIEVSSFSIFMSKTVVVQSKAEQGNGGPQSAGAAVSVADLNVPKEAVKEYNRGNEEMAKKHWAKAIDHLNKAIEIHPKFSAAYNNLAACYGRMGKKDRQREALQQAISANDHCVPALVNLAYLDITDKQITQAGDLLSKAVAADPTNVEALSLLAEVQVQEGHYQLAIEEAKKVHSLPHQHFAIVHYTAASAYEREGLIPEAIAELHVYLQEEPHGSRADLVRKVLPNLEKEAKEAQNRTSP